MKKQIELVLAMLQDRENQDEKEPPPSAVPTGVKSTLSEKSGDVDFGIDF